MGNPTDDELLRRLFAWADARALGEFVRRHEQLVHRALGSDGQIEVLVRPPAPARFVPSEAPSARRVGAGRAFAVELPPNALLMGMASRNEVGWGLDLRLYEAARWSDEGETPRLEDLAARVASAIARRPADDPGDRTPDWLKRAESLLRANPERLHAPAALAEAVGVHPGHLMREFRRHYGCTIGDFVRRLRIERACLLLRRPEGPMSVGQIAHAVGFEDQSAFGKAFRRATGVTPGEFRRTPKTAILGPTMLLRNETRLDPKL